MHRFVCWNKLAVSNVNFPGGPSEIQYARTCTLCNRISSYPPYSGRLNISRVHSTWLNPEEFSFSVNKKKKYYRIVGNPSKFKKKMRITVLDSKENTADVEYKSFIVSSPSSPAFAGPRLTNVGVTIMLPPNASNRLLDKVLQQHSSNSSSVPRSVLKSPSKKEDVKTISNIAAELMFGGLCRNRFLANSYRLSQDAVRDTKNILGPDLSSLTTFMEGLENGRKDMLNNLKLPPLHSSNADKPRKAVSTKKDAPDSEISVLSKKELQKQMIENQLTAIRVNSTKLKRILRRASFIDVNVLSGKMKSAIQYAVSGFRYFPEVPSRNILLEPLFSHAVQASDVNTVCLLLSIARTYKVALSMSSYIVCLELLGRLPESSTNMKITRTLLENMKRERVQLDDLIVHCKGRNILIQRVLLAINAVDPTYATSFEIPSDYHVDILHPLNNLLQAKAECYNSPASGLLSEGSMEELVESQIAAYSSCIFKIKNIACQLDQAEIDKLVEEQKKVEKGWRKTIAVGFESSLRNLKKDSVSYQLACVLECLPTNIFVDIIIQEVHARLDDSDKQSVGFIYAQRNLGRKVKEFYDMEVLKKYGVLENAKKAHINYCEWYANPEHFSEGPSNPREVWEYVVKGMNYDDSAASYLLREWHSDMYSKIGIFLYNILLKDVKINENISVPEAAPHMVPALYVVFRKTTKGYQKQLKMHPAVHHIFPTKMQPYLTISPHELPMVCPPRPWTTAKSGVYPLSAPCLQRSPETRIGEDALAENLETVPTHHLYPSLDSLNQLGSVPWKINKPVLDVVTEVFNSGGAKNLDIPSPPSAAQTEPPIPADIPLADRVSISKQRTLIRQENAAMYSLWCDTLYKLCIAHEFADRIFWLPHNMDFRGRVYPVCPHLQHMSNDMARSLLIFAKGEKLGPDGLNWLKMHTINLYGNMSKDSLTARLDFANEMMPKILDSAERPLTGEKWWMNSEYPWQTLAVCKEIAAALASGDPENFISHFPVHQDGSCNGLQHYAALGRDSLGAKSVNLVDSDKPSDVYLCVADLVEQQRAKDAANGNVIAQKLDGFIARKVVKQTVMTTVYGVTQYGAQMQIRGQLKDLEFPPDRIPQAASYITKLVFQSLGEMFTSSRNTQDWLTQCANGIVKSKNMPVKWITPLGLPVVQPYFKKLTVKKCLEQASESEWINPSLHRMPTSHKHKNAFSPNFIHSLDSCHMILTGLFCEQANITYVSVHDCYWVHAKNVPKMSKICREQFVALHSKPILEDLSEFLIKTYCLGESADISETAAVEERRLRRLFSSVPPKGDFDLSEILKSKYFFS